MIDFFSQGHANLPKSWRSQCRGKLENQTKDNVQFNQFPFVYFRTHDQMRCSFVVSQKKMNKEHTRGDRSHSYRLKLSHDISLIFFLRLNTTWTKEKPETGHQEQGITVVSINFKESLWETEQKKHCLKANTVLLKG